MARALAPLTFVVLGLALVAACCPDDPPAQTARTPSAARSHASSPCNEETPRGTPAQLDVASLDLGDTSVDAPLACPGRGWDGGWYVAVRGHGKRKVVYDRRPGDCDAPEKDPATCPTISVHALAQATFGVLRRELGEENVNGLGLGLCGDVRAPLERWNYSTRIHDWSFAQRAVQLISAELRRWDADGTFGLSVSGISCVELVLE